MEPTVVEGLGFAHFLTQADAVGKSVLLVLLLLSVASWYLIVTRTLANWLAGRRAAAFLHRFWQAGSLVEVANTLQGHPDNDFAVLVDEALQAQANAGRDTGLSRSVYSSYARACFILEKAVHHGGHGDHGEKTMHYEMRACRPLGVPEFCVLAPLLRVLCALRGANRGF